MKKSLAMALFCLSLIVLVPRVVHAQALTTAEIQAQLVQEWQRAKAYTIDYLNTMPADKYSFKAVDSIRSFAQQMLHLAQANYFLMQKSGAKAPPAFSMADLEHSSGAQQKDSVMYYVTSSYDYCIDAVKTADLNKAGEPVEIFGMHTNRFGMMLKTFEHQTHHRGQTTIYIRLQGIKPPQERLF